MCVGGGWGGGGKAAASVCHHVMHHSPPVLQHLKYISEAIQTKKQSEPYILLHGDYKLLIAMPCVKLK